MGFLGRLVVLTFALVALSAPAALASTVSVDIDGRGAVTSDDGEIDCGKVGDAAPTGVCVVDYCPELKCLPRTVTLQASPARGFAFGGWRGRSCTVDQAGDCSLAVTRTSTADVTALFTDAEAPEVSVPKLPGRARGTLALSTSAEDNVGIVSLSFNVGGAVIPATLVKSSWVASATPAEGATPVFATAVDAAGNTGTSKSATVVIDNSGPAIDLPGPGDGAVFGPGSTQSWGLAVSDGAGVGSIQCSVAVAGAAPSFGACSAADKHDVSGLGGGVYTFTVHAVDGLGNAAEASRGFSIDATAPVSSIVSGLGDGGSTAATSLTWDFSASEPGVVYACRVYPAALTPGAFAPCSGPTSHTAAGFSPGVYSFEVRATDAVGNIEATPLKRTFTVAAASALGARPNPTGDGRPILVSLTFAYANSTKRQTKLTSLVLKNVPAGATVTASCPKSCAKKSFKKTNAKGTVSLNPLLKKPLKAGTLITVIVSKPGSISAVKILKIQPRKSPTVTTRCQPEGATKATAC